MFKLVSYSDDELCEVGIFRNIYIYDKHNINNKIHLSAPYSEHKWVRLFIIIINICYYFIILVKHSVDLEIINRYRDFGRYHISGRTCSRVPIDRSFVLITAVGL